MSGRVRGTEPGDSVTGLVRGRRGKRVRATRSRTRRRSSRTTTCSSSRRGLHRRLARARERHGAATTSPSTRTPWRRTASATTSTTSTPTAATAATMLGVLSHYDAVVWYTGNDVITREPGWGGGNVSRLAMDEMPHPPRVPERGRQDASGPGKNAGLQYSSNQVSCTTRPRRTHSARHCRRPPIRGAASSSRIESSDLQNDVLEYWFGAYLLNDGAGLDADGNIFNVLGTDTPFDVADAHVQRGGQRAEPETTRTRSSRRAASCPRRVPAVRELGRRRATTGPAGRSTRTRASRTRTPRSRTCRSSSSRGRSPSPAEDPATLTFWTSYNTEADGTTSSWRPPVRHGNWTTLPDAITRRRAPARAARKQLERLADAASVARAVPDPDAPTTAAHRHDRRVERRLRQLRGLARVEPSIWTPTRADQVEISHLLRQ